jgi:hypothetical protein
VQHAGTKEASHFGVSGDTVPVLCSFSSSGAGNDQAAQNMAGSHLCQACQQIPAPLKQQIRKLRERRDNASGGKQYWADGCRALGLYETEEGLRIKPPSPR